MLVTKSLPADYRRGVCGYKHAPPRGFFYLGDAMLWWFTFTEAAAIRGLRTQLEAERAAHEATKRALAVMEAERDKLALVAARDRERVRAEIAAHARQRAESEGEHGQRPV